MLTSTINYHTMENNGLKVVTKTFENALFCCKNDLDNHEIKYDTTNKRHKIQITMFILQSVHLLYIYAIRINFCFIRTRRVNFSAYE
jgi:hypothetical protein